MINILTFTQGEHRTLLVRMETVEEIWAFGVTATQTFLVQPISHFGGNPEGQMPIQLQAVLDLGYGS